MRWWLLLLVGCGTSATSRDAYVENVLAEDNYEWSVREPELVRMKLTKMQRDPFGWLRGTAAVFWRDLAEPGARPTTKFGSPEASRVLLCGDPHPETSAAFSRPMAASFSTGAISIRAATVPSKVTCAGSPPA